MAGQILQLERSETPGAAFRAQNVCPASGLEVVQQPSNGLHGDLSWKKKGALGSRFPWRS